MSTNNDVREAYVTRERILELLSDAEVSRISTAETAAGLVDGEPYLDLERLERGVLHAPPDGAAPMGRVLPKTAVHAATWSKILAQLAAAASEASPLDKRTRRIFEPARLGAMSLQNRFVMAPMTRSRASQLAAAPSELSALYYEQRATAGLIVTEGTAPSPNGRGYPRIPGLWSDGQVAGWAEVTTRVHAKGAKIFAQLMHTGRVSHPLNMPVGAEVLAPSAVRLEGAQMWTDQSQFQDYPTPRAMSEVQVEAAIAEHVVAAQNAVRAGFDGVELHGANGYLCEQFLNPSTNTRMDRWGGSVENRTRFPLETIRAMARAIGTDRVGIRLSPYGNGNGMAPYADVDAIYARLADELSGIGIAYVHVVDNSGMGAPHVPDYVKAMIRARFNGTYIAAGGFDLLTAERAIADGRADLVAFGRLFLANPDLVSRLKSGWPLLPPDIPTFYTPGAKGYTDYPPCAR